MEELLLLVMAVVLAGDVALEAPQAVAVEARQDPGVGQGGITKAAGQGVVRGLGLDPRSSRGRGQEADLLGLAAPRGGLDETVVVVGLAGAGQHGRRAEVRTRPDQNQGGIRTSGGYPTLTTIPVESGPRQPS